MIPKVINYCWFGRNPKPEVVLRCIESWKTNCKGYKIIEWNEDNFDFSDCQYAVDAYKNKKWAFVSDYARIKILADNGGIYCDTDVEIIKNLDDLLDQEAFIGFELGLNGVYGVNSGSMMGSEPGNQYLIQQEKAYRTYTFGETTVTGGIKTCVDYATEILLQNGLVQNNKQQRVLGLTIYPNDYFSPRDMRTGRIELTENSRSIHRYDGTWAHPSEQYGYHLKWECIDKYGVQLGRIIYACRYSLFIMCHEGIAFFIRKIIRKIIKK